MKIKIEYKLTTSEMHPCGATALVDGEAAVGVGETWPAAKHDLLKTIASRKAVVPPPPSEEVEV